MAAMHIALYETDIPQNTRHDPAARCLSLGRGPHHRGSPVTGRAFRNAGMDFLGAAAVIRHDRRAHTYNVDCARLKIART
jgi:hypothetical protein